MKKVAAFLATEVRRGLPAFLFFFVTFHLLSFTKAVIVADVNITWMSLSVATIGALIVAKVILLTDHTSFANRFSDRRITNILWKTALFATLATMFRAAEDIIHLATKSGSLNAGFVVFQETINEPYFLALQLWLLFLVFMYCLIASMVAAIGIDHSRKLLIDK